MALVVSIALLILLVWRQGASSWGAWYGFWFGLHDHGALPWPISILMLLVLAAGMALYPALFGALLWRVVPVGSPRMLLVVAPLLWVGTEWLRVHVLTGFPWNLAGYAWDDWPVMLQVADVGGVYGLSALVVLCAAALAYPGIAMLGRADGGIRELVRTGVWAVGALLLVYGYGHERLRQLAPEHVGAGAVPLRVALVQGNIPQQLKWDRAFMHTSMEIYQQQTQRIDQPVDLIVWPETAVVFYLQHNEAMRQDLVDLVRHMGAPLLTGAPMADARPDRVATDDGSRLSFYNSAVLLDQDGLLTRRYDKHHLVPFGEFIPFRSVVPGRFSKFTEGTEDFSRGPGPVPLAWSRGNLGILICYEGIFPDEVRTLAMAGARWLVNLTNDGWFGEHAKPQHLAMTRLRAIENRLPMIRVANTGISAVMDHRGMELARMDANLRDVQVVAVPEGPGTAPWHGVAPFLPWLCFGVCGILWLYNLRAVAKS
jgi:apolipoprotein N-acyltransferase